MGAEVNVFSLFNGIGYSVKTSYEIRINMREKIEAVRNKVEERLVRIQKTREDNKLTELQVAELEAQYERDKRIGQQRQMYSTFSNAPSTPSGNSKKDEVYIPAGVVAQIVTEKGLLNSEREQISDMELILRNLKDTEFVAHPQTGAWVEREARHRLSQEAMEFLGF